MIAPAEGFPDFRQRDLRDLTHHINGDLARRRNVGVALLGTDIFNRNTVGARDFFYDLIYRDGSRLVVVDNIADGGLCDGDTGFFLFQQGIGNAAFLLEMLQDGNGLMLEPAAKPILQF